MAKPVKLDGWNYNDPSLFSTRAYTHDQIDDSTGGVSTTDRNIDISKMSKKVRTFLRQSSSPSNHGYTYYNKTFDDINDLFLHACTHGDYMLVHRLLQDGEVKADVSNKIGKSALQLAIENEHFEVVKVLLDTIPYEQFRDALLLAIYLGHTHIADFILKHPTYRTFEGGFLDPTHPQAYDESQFSSDITPLILAAQHNRLLIVHELLLRGERIKKPHSHLCNCVDCIAESASDSFRQAQVRLSAYKGLASEVYIVLTSTDPILYAFRLRHELRTLAKMEPYFSKDYKKLSHQLSIFTARLLDNVRGHEELEIVLNKTGSPDVDKYATLARFDLAIQYQEKPFVAHSNCQQNLMEKWYEQLSVIKNTHVAQRMLFYMAYLICFPFVACAYFFFPQSKVGLLCQQPNLKFKAYIFSYFVFISLIIASAFFSMNHLQRSELLSTHNETVYKNYVQLIYRNDELRNALIRRNINEKRNDTDTVINCDISLRFTSPNEFQMVIFVWVMGFLWNEIRRIYGSGLRVYMKVPSNYVDGSMTILYLLHFVFLFAAMIYARICADMFHSSNYWTRIAQFDSMSDADKEYYIAKTDYILYWLNADRFYWKNGDLQHLSEAFFAMGNVVSICRLCFLLPIIAYVGPLQVMVERLIVDISKWIIFMAAFFLAFSISLFFLYSSYAIVFEQHNDLLDSSSNIDSPTVNITFNTNISIATTDQCPETFFLFLNQSNLMLIEEGDGSTAQSTDNSSSDDPCQQAPDYSDLLIIGWSPAVYYFGQSFRATVLTTFFSLFNVIGRNGIPDRGYELIAISCYQPDPGTYLPLFNIFMENLGFVLYGLFMFICMTVLINTLIAMLEQSIERIDDHADIEWKFARSKLYMEYIRAGNTLPVPLNALPSPNSIVGFLHCVKRWMFWKKSFFKRTPQSTFDEHATANQPTNVSEIRNAKIFRQKNEKYNHHKKLTYAIVIERIVKRFLLYYRTTHHDLEEVNGNLQFKEVKQDISSLRFEIAHELDVLDEIYDDTKHSMTIFNQSLKDQFPLEQMKSHLEQLGISPFAEAVS